MLLKRQGTPAAGHSTGRRRSLWSRYWDGHCQLQSESSRQSLNCSQAQPQQPQLDRDGDYRSDRCGHASTFGGNAWFLHPEMQMTMVPPSRRSQQTRVCIRGLSQMMLCSSTCHDGFETLMSCKHLRFSCQTLVHFECHPAACQWRTACTHCGADQNVLCRCAADRIPRDGLLPGSPRTGCAQPLEHFS